VNGNLCAYDGGCEYIWVKMSENESKRRRKNSQDLFCKECIYDFEDCDFKIETCIYRKKSQKKYIEKYGSFASLR